MAGDVFQGALRACGDATIAALVIRLLSFALLALCPSAPAIAQEVDSSPKGEGQSGPSALIGESIFDGDWMTVGVGVGVSPSYEGSDEYTAFPAPIIVGNVQGFDFGARGPGLYVDAVRDGDSERRVKFVLGPQFRVRLDRVNNIKDPVVRLLGESNAAIELGFTSGVVFEKLLNPFDRLTVGVDAGWDVAGAHDGRIVSPSITYFTPLSRAAVARLSVSADHIDENYAKHYFSIDGAGSAASGLPVFTAGSGFKSVGGILLLGYDLSGNALDGGFGLYLLGSYSSLVGDAKRSPITSIRGDADQWFGAAGISYTF